MRQRGQHVEGLRGGRQRHLRTVLSRKALPFLLRPRGQAEFHDAGARCQRGKPDVVPVETREILLRHATRWPAHRPQARAFAGNAWCASRTIRTLIAAPPGNTAHPLNGRQSSQEKHAGLRVEEGAARIVLERRPRGIPSIRGVAQCRADERAPRRADPRARSLEGA